MCGHVFKAHILCGSLNSRLESNNERMRGCCLHRLQVLDNGDARHRQAYFQGKHSSLQGYLAHKKPPSPLGPPYGPRNMLL